MIGDALRRRAAKISDAWSVDLPIDIRAASSFADPYTCKATVSGAAQAREAFPDRDDPNWLKHTLCWVGTDGATRFGYRGVHPNTLTGAVESIPPKARTP